MEDEYEESGEYGGPATVHITGPIDNDLDEDTIRIMVSTDNHLGFLEKDPVRGNDSFAAFEEVLSLAKRYRVCECDGFIKSSS